MIARRVIAAIVLATCISSTAAAQTYATKIGGKIRKADAAELMQITARCIAERGPAYASEVLETVPGTEAEFRLIRRNEGDLAVCMDNTEKEVGAFEMTFTPRPFRTALAAEMLRVKLRKDIDTTNIASAEPWYLVSLDTLAEGEGVDAQYLVFMEFGDCVLLKNPQAALDFLRAENESDDESKAVQQLLPSLSPCVQAGDEIEITIDALRVALAEPAYHRIRRMAEEG